MNYTVVWVRSAEAMLAHLWNTAPDRNAAARASNTIDNLLGCNPMEVGESRSDPYRMLIVPPLAVHYKVSEDDRLVQVLRVWVVKAKP
jgi:hypothetical protein